MFKYFNLVILLILLNSCGDANRVKKPHNKLKLPNADKVLDIDSQLYQYIASFNTDWQNTTGLDLKVEDLIVEFGEIDQSHHKNNTVTLGRCYMQIGETPRIVIHTPTWENLSETGRQIIMYHELGHCVLFRNHILGHNTSVMNPSIPDDDIFRSNEDSFLSELFDPDKYNSWDLFTINH